MMHDAPHLAQVEPPSGDALVRAISENVQDRIVVVRAERGPGGEIVEWRCVEANAAAAELLETTRERLVGSTLGAALPSRAAALRPRLARILETGVRERYEASFLGRAFLVTVFRVDPSTVASAALELSAHERAQGALREAHRRLRAHVETMPLGVVEWSAEYRVVGLSPRAEEILGWSAGEVLGKRIDEIPWIPEEDWPSVRAVMRDMSSGTRPTNVNANRNLRRDGSVVHCEWYNTTVHDDAGRLVSVLSLVLDVTARVRAEESLRDADRRKDEFLAMLSHELRNPLGPIRNALFVLERADPTGPQAGRAREIAKRQVAHLARLVDDLLDVTRIGRGKIVLRRAALDLGALARRAAEDHRALIDARGLALDLDVPDAPVSVVGDETRLAQVLGNLLSNAAKFTPAGGRVTLAVRAEAGRAVLHVRDTGAGIEPAMREAIFAPFTQGRQTLARAEGGLGLGLALVKGLVGLHGGTVQVASEGPGRGSDFVVTLPLAGDPPGAGTLH